MSRLLFRRRLLTRIVIVTDPIVEVVGSTRHHISRVNPFSITSERVELYILRICMLKLFNPLLVNLFDRLK